MVKQASTVVVEFDYSDVPELANFIAAQSGRNRGEVESHLRWFILGNPALQPDFPIGCGLRAADGTIAGCLVYCPQKFWFEDKEFLLLGASLFYVDQTHLGSGGLIFLKYAQLGKQLPLFCNSANANAARLWKACGAAPIPDSDHEFLGVVRWSGVLEESLHRRFGQRWLAKLGGKIISPLLEGWRSLKLGDPQSAELVPLFSPEQVAELPALQSHPQLTGARNLDFIRWRYFAGPDESAGVYRFRGANSTRAFLVAVNQRLRGYRKQIRSLNLLDIFPKPSAPETLSIMASLLHRYHDGVDVLVLRNIDAERGMRLIDSGFLRRPFDSFNGWVLDKYKAMPSPEWYFVPADCDWFI